MSFVDAHDFPAGLVLRVLDIADVDLLRLAGPARVAEPPRARRRRAARTDPQSAQRQRVRRDLRLPAGVAGAAPPRACGSGASASSDSCAPTACKALTCGGAGARLDPAEPEPHRRPGPGRPGLPGRRPEPALGGRPDPAGHRRGRAVAGQRARRVRQPHRRLGHRPARHHRRWCSPRSTTRCARATCAPGS